ncbi:unnamed protein product [Brachionus calyciflorus]|uniref:Uncharacterized protein n=1 Tax=Brachionus calyciflorus TaxID=104777 RepID=A0A814RFP5_9BILA|nr:unnamed protein product [Brachionus calyciflorus]
MKLAGIQRKKIAQVLENLGTYHVDTVQNYAKKIILGDNLQVFEEERGKYFRPTVFEVYPDLKDEIKTFVIGLTWGNNKKRPFFQGHEREDVVQSRNEFVKLFSESKSLFDRLIKTEKETDFLEHSWENAEKNVKRVIIFHDETSLRSGEVQNQNGCILITVHFLEKAAV